MTRSLWPLAGSLLGTVSAGLGCLWPMAAAWGRA